MPAPRATLTHVDPLMATERDGLAERARSGDMGAFRAIFELHSGAVRRFLRDLLGDGHAAEEALQETFVRAHRGLQSVREDSRLCAWLLGIARNVFYETLRARRRYGGEPSEHAVDLAATPEHDLLGKEADRLLNTALGALSAERRAALLLRLDHDLPYEEIARIMGWSLQKVKNEIHRARLELRRRLGPYLDLGGGS